MERAITRARTRRNYVFIICRESRLHWLRGYKPKKMDRKIDNIVRHAEVSEKAIEAYLVKRVNSREGVDAVLKAASFMVNIEGVQ